MHIMGTEAEYPVFVSGDKKHKQILGQSNVEAMICSEILHIRNLPEGIVSTPPIYVDNSLPEGGRVGQTNHLNNGDRLYPEVISTVIAEMATRTCKGALETMLCDQRGIAFLRQVTNNVVNLYEKEGVDVDPFYLLRRTVGSDGKTTGHHINIKVPVSLEVTLERLGPLFAGMIGGIALFSAGNTDEQGNFNIFQKSTQVGRYIADDTTLPVKPLINTRDKPYADRNRFRRLHVVGNDILHSPWATWLRLGFYESLVAICEEDPESAKAITERLPHNLRSAMWSFSGDPDFTTTTLGIDGKSYTVLDYLEMAVDLWNSSAEKGRISEDGEDAERAPARQEINYAHNTSRRKPDTLKDIVDWRYRQVFADEVKESGRTIEELRSLEIHSDDVCDRKFARKYQEKICRFGFERLSKVLGVSVEFLNERANDIHYVEPGGRAEVIATKIEETRIPDTNRSPIKAGWQGWLDESGEYYHFYGDPDTQEETVLTDLALAS